MVLSKWNFAGALFIRTGFRGIVYIYIHIYIDTHTHINICIKYMCTHTTLRVNTGTF